MEEGELVSIAHYIPLNSDSSSIGPGLIKELRAMNIQDIMIEVSNFDIKAFATDHIEFGIWTISAHACGYYLCTSSGYRFSFTPDQLDELFSVISGIEKGEMVFVSYSSGSGHIRLDGSIRKINVNASSAGEFFVEALKKMKFQVVAYGDRSTLFSTDYASVVRT